MKIAIIGYSGSGKTTLARILSKIYNIENVLHMDSLHFDPNWVEVDRNISIERYNEFLNNHDSWIIEDVGRNKFRKARDAADIIYYIELVLMKNLN